jgi:hypothetical protein
MSEASKDPKKESLKNRAELLKQELSAAITSRDLTSAAGILKKLQGMPSEFVPADLSSLAEQLKSEISSNSALGSESAAEAARKAKEEEERKEREKALHDVRSTLLDIDKYYEDEKTKARYELYKNVAAKGEYAPEEEVKESMSVYAANRDEAANKLEELKRAEKRMKELRASLAKLPKDSEEYKNTLKAIEELAKGTSKTRGTVAAHIEKDIEYLLSPPVVDKVFETKDGKGIKGRDEAARLTAKIALMRGREEEIDHGTTKKEKVIELKPKQGEDQLQAIISVLASKAKSDKIAISLTTGVVSASPAITSPSSTPSSPKVFKNREKPISK